MNNDKTTIKISKDFKHFLDEKGKKNQSYEDILKEMARKAKEYKW